MSATAEPGHGRRPIRFWAGSLTSETQAAPPLPTRICCADHSNKLSWVLYNFFSKGRLTRIFSISSLLVVCCFSSLSLN